jgi:murein DD-endopeptidase MepM/ murein hydrolase activator NlpD
MAFWDFLNWLWGKIDNVLTWFGAQFQSLYDGARNAWYWAYSQASSALASAKSWVLDKSYAVTTWVDSKTAWIQTQVDALSVKIVTWSNNAYNNSIAWVKQQSYAVTTWVNGLISGVQTWASSTISTTGALLTDFINSINTTLRALYDPLIPLKGKVNTLLSLSSDNVFTRLSTMVNEFFGTLSIVVKNPLGFITGLLFPIFAEIFQYAIGYGLGAVESQLPPLPDWGNGTGGPWLPPVLPPEGSGVLVHPVDPVWVSGYTFTPPTHYGVDLGISYGQPIYAMHNGVVVEAQFSSVGYGFNVVIQNETYWSRYGHLETLMVVVGQQVEAGQQLGKGDTTGNSTGNHLHLELKVNGTFVDPLLYL